MGIQKMSLANIKGKLSRTEMKNIMAGSGATCTYYCNWTPGVACGVSSCTNGPGGNCITCGGKEYCC